MFWAQVLLLQKRRRKTGKPERMKEKGKEIILGFFIIELK
jgi:hypothetical protein